MRVVLTGATGMVGGGVLQACLEDEGIEAVLSVARRKVGIEHRKLTQLVMPDLFDLAAHGDALSGFDACLYCLGVSAVGMSEAEYRRVTHDLVGIVNLNLVVAPTADCATATGGVVACKTHASPP